MKEGYLDKVASEITDEELELINKQSRRQLKRDEVFVFSIILCDNEIDRDFERFTTESLHKLAELYIGKSGIFDHSMKGKDQMARIFACEVEPVTGKKTSTGEDYMRLKARAYMPKTSRNEDLRTEIDAGIKKEVSIGCSVAKTVCSICGNDMRSNQCKHVKGRQYKSNGAKKLCYAELINPADAFEWSFVAVPAQPKAGVVKSYGLGAHAKGEDNLDIATTVKSLSAVNDNGVLLHKSEAEALGDYIRKMEYMAGIGETYLHDLKADVLKSCSIAKPELKKDVMESVCDKMSIDELKAFKSVFNSDIDKMFPPTPQIAPYGPKAEKEDYKEFKI